MSSQFILVRHSSIQKEVKPLQINIYKDKMPGACLFGASVLYSAKPIPREDVPQGWYCYDLRGTARHPDEPHALVELAEENHVGSILSYLPLKKGGSQFRLVKDMMSQAQSESESLSGNVKWGHRKNFRDGKVYNGRRKCSAGAGQSD